MYLYGQFLLAFLAFFILLNANAEDVKDKEPKIVGGEIAIKNEFPWIVNLRRGGELFCGGSIINKDWILTAAHCVYGRESQAFNVVAGDHQLSTVEDTEQNVPRSTIIIHERYSDIQVDYDVALVRLTRSLNFTNAVSAIALPPSTFNATGTVTVAGWGTLFFGSTTVSPVLRKVNVTIVSQAVCQREYLGAVTITNNMVCAASPGKDSCQGDSGGPLTCRSGTSTYLCGVVSFGNGCATPNFSGVYAKVTAYLDWIRANMEGNPIPSSSTMGPPSSTTSGCTSLDGAARYKIIPLVGLFFYMLV